MWGIILSAVMKVSPSISAETNKSYQFPQKLKLSTSLTKLKKIQIEWDPASMSVTTALHSKASKTTFSSRQMLRMWSARNLPRMIKNSTWLWPSHSKCRAPKTSMVSKRRAFRNKRSTQKGRKPQSTKIYSKSSDTELNKRTRSKKWENSIWVHKSRSKSRWWRAR